MRYPRFRKDTLSLFIETISSESTRLGRNSRRCDWPALAWLRCNNMAESDVRRLGHGQSSLQVVDRFWTLISFSAVQLISPLSQTREVA